jgi:hypothetical protein
MKFKPGKHITGKVYDFTKENMNAIIKAFEEEKKRNRQTAGSAAVLRQRKSLVKTYRHGQLLQ